MPTLYGSMPYGQGETLPCVWCKQPTDIRFMPAGMPDLGPQPLHIGCGMLLVRAYDRARRGEVIDAHSAARLKAIAAPTPQLRHGPPATRHDGSTRNE